MVVLSYKDFKNLEQVLKTFDLELRRTAFIQQKTFKNLNKHQLDALLTETLPFRFNQGNTFRSEHNICERLIFPLLELVAIENNYTLFGHERFDVDKTLGLDGFPDYIIGREDKYSLLDKPVMVVGEAKKDDFTSGWGQCGAELVAAQKRNDSAKTVYGVVSNGKLWEFAKLKNNLIFLELNPIVISPANYELLALTLNWLCSKQK